MRALFLLAAGYLVLAGILAAWGRISLGSAAFLLEGLEVTLEGNALTLLGRRDDGFPGGQAVYRESRPAHFRRVFELDPAIDTAKASNAAALNVLASPLLFANRQVIIERAGTLRLPAIYQWPEVAEQGGFIGYGPRIVQLFRELLARQLVKLLRGAKPAEIPVEQPTHFELVINLKTAQAIGHEVPAGLVLRADKVIE